MLSTRLAKFTFILSGLLSSTTYAAVQGLLYIGQENKAGLAVERSTDCDLYLLLELDGNQKRVEYGVGPGHILNSRSVVKSPSGEPMAVLSLNSGEQQGLVNSENVTLIDSSTQRTRQRTSLSQDLQDLSNMGLLHDDEGKKYDYSEIKQVAFVYQTRSKVDTSETTLATATFKLSDLANGSIQQLAGENVGATLKVEPVVQETPVHPRLQAEREALEMLAKWARAADGSPEEKALEDQLMANRRIITFGRTYQGTNQREELKIGRVVWLKNRMIFIYSQGGKISLLIGAPVEELTMELAGRNSAYLFNAPNETNFQNILRDIVRASDRIKDRYGIDAYTKQDMFNRMVMMAGPYAIVDFELNKFKSTAHLFAFLTELAVTPYLNLDEMRVQEIPVEAVRLKIKNGLLDMGFTVQEARDLVVPLLNPELRNTPAFAIIADFSAAQQKQ